MHKILPILFLPICTSCVDFDYPDRTDEPWVDPASTIQVPTEAGSVEAGHVYTILEIPSCGDESLAGAIEGVRSSDEAFVAPSLIENFGSDGCIDSRRRQTFLGENQTGPIPDWEWYETIDPSINVYVYVPYLSYERSWSYGHRGELLRIEGSVGDDEVSSFHETFQYDDEGRTISHVKQGDPLFPNDRLITQTWQYNQTGALIEHSTFDGHTRITYERFEYDQRDRPIERYVGSTDLSTRLATTWVYGHGEGAVMREDFDINGALQKTTHYEYGFEANTLTREVQKFHDRQWRDTYIYDANGNELSFTQDENDDGVVEYTRVRQYDEQNQTTFDRTEYDYQHGVPQVWRENTTRYDEQGRVVEGKQVRRSFNNSRDPRYLIQTTIESYEHHPNRWTVTMSNFDELAPNPVVRQVSHYRASGVLTEQWRDDDRTGVVELKMRAAFNSDGAMVERRHFTSDFTGIEQWFYDDAGQLLRQQSDFDGDGVVEARTEQRFQPRFAQIHTD